MGEPTQVYFMANSSSQLSVDECWMIYQKVGCFSDKCFVLHFFHGIFVRNTHWFQGFKVIILFLLFNDDNTMCIVLTVVQWFEHESNCHRRCWLILITSLQSRCKFHDYRVQFSQCTFTKSSLNEWVCFLCLCKIAFKNEHQIFQT